MKRFMLIVLVLVAVMAIAAPLPSVACCEPEAWVELVRARSYVPGEGVIDFTVEKTVDGDWRQSLLHIVIDGPGIFVNTPLIALEGDPDWASVSEDLGWGGLDTVVRIYNSRGHTWHTMEIHIDNYANTSIVRVWEDSGFWYRTARVKGYVLLDGEMFRDFNLPYEENGWIGSTAHPDEW